MISYASQRKEVWRWYWQAWRRGLWRIHLLTFLTVATFESAIIYGGVPRGGFAWLTIILIGCIPIVGFVAFPMLKFKPQIRTLTVTDDGIESTIGSLEKSIPWHDISDVTDDGDCLILQLRNKNAFIIPHRAFNNADDRAKFRDFVFMNTQREGR